MQDANNFYTGNINYSIKGKNMNIKIMMGLFVLLLIFGCGPKETGQNSNQDKSRETEENRRARMEECENKYTDSYKINECNENY